MDELILPADATLLVASDMHLGDHDPGTARFFLAALDAQLADSSHLLLLGDLFEAWPGDDQADPVASLLVQRLRALTDQRTQVLVMRGNRDFLLDIPFATKQQASFAEQTGATMLEDPTLLRVGSTQLLLMHGDSLCTDDVQYQQFRAENRTRQWQQAFLSQSLAQRVSIARKLREQSKAHQRDQAVEITDVNSKAVNQAMTDANTASLLHGHTHRPDTHRWCEQGQKRTRYVLPDWDEQGRRGGFIRITRDGPAAVSISTDN